eukprot:2415802-Prorocentrum_lima.AAC.1
MQSCSALRHLRPCMGMKGFGAPGAGSKGKSRKARKKLPDFELDRSPEVLQLYDYLQDRGSEIHKVAIATFDV